ncbi:hypothetical protein K0M31_008441 [Melipona bicolor]|uniref:Uncharacterized protein n=1 Tax=Melipona bicolor TaxID=60889 RepID=A0AA40KKU0_9HYME|nr:hypothetical protein K0M31_008441 [Melipona bicolor]
MLNNYYRSYENFNKYSHNEKEISSESCSTCSSSTEILQTTKLNIVLTSKGLQIYGTWSTEKLLKLLTDRLKQCIRAQSDALKNISIDVANDKRLLISIYSGLYSIRVLKELREKGMPIYNIIKAMKLGLISLSYCELHYFKEFNVEPYSLEFKEMWTTKFNDELILNLKSTGLDDMNCWNIIVHGVALQTPNILRHLTLSGIDIPGILNWQSPVNSASSKIIEFLRLIGIEENVVQLVEQYGIDEETEQMLVDLGLNAMEEKFPILEELICECSLTILEPINSCLEITQEICKTNSRTSSSFTSLPEYYQQCACQCHISAKNKTVYELTAQRNDYLRQNVMVPLSWAMAKTLEYKPSDPIHFMGYKLLQWIFSNVPKTKKDNLQELIALSTIEMDRKLVEKKRLEKEKLIKNLNEEAMKNIPCDICKGYQELYRIKKQCWKCVWKPLKKFESCEFPEICSLCKISVSDNNVLGQFNK